MPVNPRIFLFLLFALVAGPAAADDCKLQQAASFDVVIDSNGVAVPATVEGRSGYFLLDLNASYSQFSKPAAETLRLRMMPTKWDSLYVAYGHEVVKAVNPTVHFGNAAVQISAAVVSPPWQDNPALLGVLGRDFLWRYDVELDLAHNKVNLFSQDHCDGKVVYWTTTAPVAAIPYVFPHVRLFMINQAQFTIPMKLDGKDVKGEITLAPTDTIFPDAVRDRFGMDAAARSLTFKSLELDGILISNPKFNVLQVDPETGCDPAMTEPYNSEAPSTAKITSCTSSCDIQLAVPELRKLRMFLAFRENKLYATAADAN